MTDVAERLQGAIYHEACVASPNTTTLIEAAREAAYEIVSLRGELRAEREECLRLRAYIKRLREMLTRET